MSKIIRILWLRINGFLYNILQTVKRVGLSKVYNKNGSK